MINEKKTKKADNTDKTNIKKSNESETDFRLFDKYLKIITSHTKNTIFILFLLLGIVHQIGYRFAEIKGSYWALTEDKNKILIAIYGDIAIYKKIDAHNIMSDEVIVSKLSESKPETIKKVRLKVYNSSPNIQKK